MQLYTNLNDVRPYACLFYRRSWEEWTEHISFYLRSISTFFWTWLLTVHQCSRKTASLWHLTLLISQTNVNIWYLRSCISERVRYFVIYSYVRCNLCLYFGMKICYIFNNTTHLLTVLYKSGWIGYSSDFWYIYSNFTWDIPLWQRKENRPQ